MSSSALTLTLSREGRGPDSSALTLALSREERGPDSSALTLALSREERGSDSSALTLALSREERGPDSSALTLTLSREERGPERQARSKSQPSKMAQAKIVPAASRMGKRSENVHCPGLPNQFGNSIFSGQSKFATNSSTRSSGWPESSRKAGIGVA
jgi:hypothetical protein